jgi:hypothetical protein
MSPIWHIITTAEKQLIHSCTYSQQEEFEDTKGLIKIRKSKKNRQHNDQKKKGKQRSTIHTHKTKDRVTRTPLKTGGELRCSLPSVKSLKREKLIP